MCEMQYLRTVNGNRLTKEAIQKFEELVSSGKVSNEHGHGWIAKKDKTILSEKGMDYSKTVERLKELNEEPSELIFHSRFATHGEKQDRNAHPFRLGNIIWMHNGIISNHQNVQKAYGFKSHGHPDSYVIGQLVEHFLRGGASETEAITKACEELEGSFSVFLVIGTHTYYFRNGCSFKFGLFEHEKVHYIIGATDATMVNHIAKDMLYGFELKSEKWKKLSELSPVEGFIYRLTGKGIEEVAYFDPAQNIPTTVSYARSYGDYGNYRVVRQKETDPEYDSIQTVKIPGDKGDFEQFIWERE